MVFFFFLLLSVFCVWFFWGGGRRLDCGDFELGCVQYLEFFLFYFLGTFDLLGELLWKEILYFVFLSV